MTALVLSILFSTGIYVMFGFIKRAGLQTLPCILVNYLTASVLGFAHAAILHEPASAEATALGILKAPWFPMAAAMGALFVSVFFLVGKTSQSHGITVATVASKMSMAIPVAFTVLFLGEPLSTLRSIGFVLALAAVFLTSARPNSTQRSLSHNILLPLLVFAGSGLVDVAIKYAEHAHYTSPGFTFLSPTVFFFAACFGTAGALALDRHTLFGTTAKNFFFGIVLGVTNYFSLVYILHAMADPALPSAVLFSVNNLGIVCLTAAAGYFLFGEKPTKINLLGLLLAIAAVLLMNLA